jgi:hypothetical protein
MQTTVFSEKQMIQVEQLRLPLVRRPKGGTGRHDSLPEFTRYKDDGCEVSESCFDCPLPRCRYEEPGGLRAVLNETRDRQILLLRSKGLGVDDLAGRFGVSRRTVFRIIGTAKTTTRNETIERDRTPIPIRPQQQQDVRKEAHCA